MRRPLLLPLALLLTGAGYAPDPRDTLRALAGDAPDVRYTLERADLNADGREEVVAYLQGPTICGSGGCSVAVLTPTSAGWRLIGGFTVSRLPLRTLNTRSVGWRDLGVTIGGVGARGGLARIRFSRGRYRGNPTLAPAVPPHSGRTLISADAPLAPLP